MRIVVSRGGTNFGPYSLRELHEYGRTGRLLPHDAVWVEGAAKWMSLASILESANGHDGSLLANDVCRECFGRGYLHRIGTEEPCPQCRGIGALR